MMETLIAKLCSFVGVLMPFECMQMHFMQQAMLAILLCAPMAAVMGVQIVNFRMAFFSDAIGHSAFAGVAIGLIFSVSPNLTMPLLALATGLGIMTLSLKSKLSSDTIIGVFFSAVVAFGLAIVSRNRNVARDMQMFLYGDILTIDDAGVIILGGIFAIFIVFQLLCYNRLTSIGIDSKLARAHKINITLYQYAFAALLSLIVIFSVRAVGVILVTALLVVPAATAKNLCKSSSSMFWISMITGLSSGVTGLVISAQEWAQTAAGATIVLCACILFCISAVVGLISKKLR